MRHFVVIVALLFAAPVFADLPASGYAYAMLGKPGSDITDGAPLVDLSILPAGWWSSVDTSDGEKIRIAKSDGTELARDVIDFDDTGETGLVRFKWSGTWSSTVDQYVRIYWPRASLSSYVSSSTYGSDNAYDTYWVAHYPDGGGVDRTSNGFDLTGTNITAGDTAGQIGAGTTYNGTSSRADVDISSVLLDEPFTLISWARIDNAATGMIASLADPALTHYHSINWTDANEAKARTFNGTSNDSVLSYSSEYNFTFYAGVFASSYSRQITVNTTNGTSNSAATSVGTDRFTLGMSADSTPFGPLGGVISQTSLHSIDRPYDWLFAEYLMVNDNATSYGPWTLDSTPTENASIILRTPRRYGHADL